jgi:hypothetical protein
VTFLAIFKAKTRDRSSWLDELPADARDRSQYKIAEKSWRKLAAAFEDLVDDLAEAVPRARLEAAVEARDADAALALLPRANAKDERLRVPWQNFEERLTEIFGSVIEESGKNEAAKLGGSRVHKAKKAPGEERASFRFDFTLDNPHSQKWIREHVGELIKGFSDEAVAALRSMLATAFEQGTPPKEFARKLLDEGMIGLLQRDADAVDRRFLLSVSRGMSPEEAKRQASDYADQLLRERAELIARTETIAAEAAGVDASWRVAQDAGLVTEDAERVWIAATASDRTCPICMGLDDKRAPLGESFEGDDGENYDNPPAHPGCRCTIGLVRAGESQR